MAGTALVRADVYAFMIEKAEANETLTSRELEHRFGASGHASKKLLSLLAGNGVLVETSTPNEFWCDRVRELSLIEFESAASQGKRNTAYARRLWGEIERLRADNARLRGQLRAESSALGALG